METEDIQGQMMKEQGIFRRIHLDGTKCRHGTGDHLAHLPVNT
jgi:hypothetical protein